MQGTSDYTLLPVNKRFFPGGDGSIRGYQAGEASPRGPDGRFLGAKLICWRTLSLNRRSLRPGPRSCSPMRSGCRVRLADYPFEENDSVGLGVRYQTLIGPVRVEYGRT
jgi:outer membrane translocation and assembly module TamA